MISCGEPSGDLYAGALASEILKLEPDAVITGFGSDRLRAAGASLVGDFKGLSVTGLTEAVRVIPRSWQNYRALVRAAEDARPDVFVPIDFPDFNFFPARALHKRGVPVVYYISPQLWAWRRGRLKTMKRVADRVLVIFPFEAPFYEAEGVPVTFVGHPLLELTPAPEAREPFLRGHGLDPARPVVALLPGSRRNELRALLPDLVRTAGVIARRVPAAQFLIARAPHLDDELLAPLADWPDGASRPVVVEGQTDAVLASADVAVLASGTVTVQAALARVPDGDRLSRRPAHLQARQAAAARRHLRHGQSRRRIARRPRADSGRLHAGGGGRRSAEGAAGSGACREGESGSRRRPRPAWHGWCDAPGSGSGHRARQGHRRQKAKGRRQVYASLSRVRSFRVLLGRASRDRHRADRVP